ncbi:hydrogenase expression/formation protein HypE [Solirubrobacter ginsenosidimutans]|uniref:Hydrogenase expression/formation protein HypE n=1 Tax=Solirubrobacter ginsenosidimutans TaxID=490573 RepID=A0A9X3S3R2_9ACTN|nr:hydrogenase expression/formation protein HypE [Solirubrobacter ginsenosidimutans]MDA0164894.1 hydrogenase expression/formation protein HypE [Solirubrobacter ginsenosidimutans]
MSSVSEREQRVLGIIETARGKRAKFRDERITMAHGAGGKATRSLVEGLLAPAFGIKSLDDAATIGELALTTDAFVVKPLRFPGGSIGELAVNGTVNDLAMGGAKPLALTLSLILEEGLGSDVLRAEVDAIARAATQAGVRIVGGDTKVVERGHADGMYITTTGLGQRDQRAQFQPARPGDRILLSGPIAAHGTAIMLARGEFDLDSDEIVSDTRSLWPAVDAILGLGAVRRLRDATRGGVASVLNELARDDGVAMLIQESAVPVAPAVAGACELLGIDPMYVANEGVFLAIVEPGFVAPGFVDIGEVKTDPPGMVLVATSFGGKRVLDELVGDPLPRIC